MICSLSDTKRAAPVTTKCMCRNNLSDFFSVKTLLCSKQLDYMLSTVQTPSTLPKNEFVCQIFGGHRYSPVHKCWPKT